MNDDREYGPWADADRLMTATRALMRAASTTGVSGEQLAGIVERIETATTELDAVRRARARRIPFTDDDREEVRAGAAWRMFPYNALGIPQTIAVADGVAHSEVALTALHEGPPGMLHGGFAAAMLDAALGVLVMVDAVPAVTAQLDVRFVLPTPLDQTVQVSARIVETTPTRIIAEGTISHGGAVTVSARGVFVPFALPPRPRAS